MKKSERIMRVGQIDGTAVGIAAERGLKLEVESETQGVKTGKEELMPKIARVAHLEAKIIMVWT